MPTASDMARLGNMLVSAQHQRNAGVTGLRIETREFMGDLHDLTRARRRDTRRHAAETGRFVGELHDTTRARKDEMHEHAAETARFVGELHSRSRTRRRDMRQHAAETGRFVGELHDQSRARRRDTRRHAAETGRFVGQLHDITRARKGEVRRHAAQTAEFVGYLHGVTRERMQEVSHLLSEAQQFMAGLTAITKGGRSEWRRQQAAIGAARKTGTGTKRRASRQGGDVGGPMLAYIAQHPGTRLPQIEQALRINRIEAARTVRALLDEGRIKRDEGTREYFPA